MRSAMALLARDVMEPDVLSVSSNTSVVDLGDFLISHRIGGVPVVDDGRLVGIVSRSDIVRAASLDRSLAGMALEGVEQDEFAPTEAPDPIELLRTVSRSIEPRTVREIMVVETLTVAPDTPVTEVARILTSRHLHRVVVTEGGHVRGVITALDLVRLVADGRLAER
jgi:CBS domain-containing protein